MAVASWVSAALSPRGQCCPGLGECFHAEADLRAYSAGCLASPQNPHSSDCINWRVSSF